MTANDPLTTLRVTVSENDGVTRYRYELRSSGGTDHGALEQEYSVEVNPQLIRDLCKEIDEVLAKALAGDPGYRDRLTAKAGTLYNHLFRPVQGNDEPALVVKVRELETPLLVRSNEMLVPWELLHDGHDFLGLVHDLGQGSVVARPFLLGRDVGRLDRALIIGDPLGDLPAARREAEQIARWLTDNGTQCRLLLGERATLADVVTELSSTPYDLLHYCGHITIRNKPSDSGLLLHRRGLLNESALKTASRIGAPPVVFINGCQAAGPIANLCVSFMTMGAKVVVGTRAEVAEESAQRFAEAFYRQLLKDRTAGAAMRKARAEVRDERDGAWASFLLYGNPSVHITGGQGLVAHPDPLEGGHYSPEAVTLLDHVYAAAAERGIVISFDLLLGLVTAPDLRPVLVKSVGSDGLGSLVKMLYELAGVAPGTQQTQQTRLPSTNGHKAEVQLSDTVHAALIKARDIATAEGRSAVTPRDIATGYAEVGGGSSGQILETFGVSVRELLVPDTVKGGSKSVRLPSEQVARMFDGTGELRPDMLSEPVADAVRAALLLATAKRSVIGSHTFLQGFGFAGSEVLRAALAKQGDVGQRAVRLLFEPKLNLRDLSHRSFAALEAAVDNTGETLDDETAVLLALLAEDGSAARQLLDKLGIDHRRLVQDLREPGGGTGPQQAG